MPEVFHPAPDPGAGRRRVASYAGLIVLILLAFLSVRHAGWKSDMVFHTLLETVSTVLAAVVGCLALVRYYSEKKTMFLFIGMGFLATTFLDGFHGVVSSARYMHVFPDASASRIYWSWTASRTYLSLLLWFSCLFWQREQRLGPAGKIADGVVYAIVGVLALACYGVVELLPMPPAYQDGGLISRAQDLLAALFFLLALLAYLRKGHWRMYHFDHWLLLSLIIGFMGQALFMPTSSELFDAMFDGAHLLKIASYLCIMIGLLFSMHRLYKESLARQELVFKNTILATQQELSREAILVVNGHERIISYNRNFVDLWGIGQSVMDTGSEVDALKLALAQMQDPQADLARIQSVYQHKTEKSSEEVTLKDGRILDRYSAPMLGADGSYYGRVWYFRDITERRREERRVQDERNFSDKLIASLPGTFVVFDTSGKYIRWNDRQKELLGLSDAQMAASSALDFVDAADRPRIAQQIRQTLEYGSATTETRVTGLRGPRDYTFSTMCINMSSGDYVIAVGSDITLQKQAEREVHQLQEQLREQAIHDPLTGLYNRRYLDETIGRELIRARRAGHEVGIVMCDIDFFKRVNDTWGHLAGDEVLKAFAALLSRNARGSDIVCRYGGEEFVLLLADIPPNLAYQRAESLRMALEAMSIAFGETAIRVTASFGVANFPEHGTTQDELIHAADSAMYLAKTSGRNRVMIASEPTAAALPP
ncbi:MAG: diguanylate cyclase [Hydrogenophaga sp.]|nr:diguanylate cyclase [Hydrogenophaga sp.]